MTKKKNYYKFVWTGILFKIDAGTILYTRLYATREGDSCLLMKPLEITTSDKMNIGETITTEWKIEFHPD